MARVALLALCISSFGCFSATAPVDPAASNYLAQQIRYSRKIPDPNARASAMVAIARSAAFNDDLDHYDRAMRDLRGDPRHDETAVQCAQFLAEAGKLDSAKKVAKRIDDPARKQEVIAKIAEKESPPPAGKGDTTAK